MSNPAARRSYVEAEVITGIAHQIRILRLQRNWTQRDLARRLGTTQAAVSRLEDPSYGRASVQTLLQLAAVFDVALNLRFGSFTKFFTDTWKVRRQNLEVAPFDEERENVGFVSNLSSSYIAAKASASSSSVGVIGLFDGTRQAAFNRIVEASRDTSVLFANPQLDIFNTPTGRSVSNLQIVSPTKSIA